MPIKKLLNYTNFIKFIQNTISGKIYCSEAQLQFDIAWELNNLLVSNGCSNWKVYLEYPAIVNIKKSGKDETYYIDIILLNETTEEYIPIEIKYKTSLLKEGSITILKNQSALDFGRFDFLWDVNRIQTLKSKKGKMCSRLKKFLFGYAVMLTNDKLYYVAPSRTRSGKSCCDDFRIHETRQISALKPLDWKSKPSSKTGSNWRYNSTPIILNNNYICKWNCVKMQYTKDFKFLVFKV